MKKDLNLRNEMNGFFDDIDFVKVIICMLIGIVEWGNKEFDNLFVVFYK